MASRPWAQAEGAGFAGGLEVWETLGLGLWDVAPNGLDFGCGSRWCVEQHICEREPRDQDSGEEEEVRGIRLSRA